MKAESYPIEAGGRRGKLSRKTFPISREAWCGWIHESSRNDPSQMAIMIKGGGNMLSMLEFSQVELSKMTTLDLRCVTRAARIFYLLFSSFILNVLEGGVRRYNL